MKSPLETWLARQDALYSYERDDSLYLEIIRAQSEALKKIANNECECPVYHDTTCANKQAGQCLAEVDAMIGGK